MPARFNRPGSELNRKSLLRRELRRDGDRLARHVRYTWAQRATLASLTTFQETFNHVRHHPAPRVNSAFARGCARVAAQPGLGLRSQRRHWPGADYRVGPRAPAPHLAQEQAPRLL